MAESLRLELLGGMRLTFEGAPLAPFVSNKVPALLCYLAVTGRAHARTTLAGLLWSDLPEEAARRNLRVVLANLRQSLEPYIISTRDTIAFNRASSYWLDVEQLEAALREDAPVDVKERHAAVALYEGDFLDGFVVRDASLFEDWMLLQREQLRQTVIKALQGLIDRYTAQHPYAAAIDACTRLLQLDPWREDTHRTLMHLFARNGQRAAALAQYQLCQQALNEAFGAEPSPETTALYEQIQASELPGIAAPQPIAPLPIAPTPLLGREDERARLLQLFANPACRLVTLIGPGGMGKTRLAVDVATHLQASVAAVAAIDLAPVRDSALVITTIARALNVREMGDRSLLDNVTAYLRDNQMLLLLDNCEQVIEAAPVIAALLAGCPDLRVLATSREALHLRGEQLFPVAPLKLPDRAAPFDYTRATDYAAVALFVERATQHQPSFALSAANAAAVVEICWRLDGLPLAIELAATRIKLFPPEQLVQRLSNRLDLLTRGPRDLPVRQQTLQNMIDWSYTLLNSAEQRLFAQLAVFVGGWTLDAIEAVCGVCVSSSHDIFDTFQGLIDKQLVQPEPQASDRQRFTMLETIREYAQMQLAQHGASNVLHERHATYYLEFMESAAATIERRPHSAYLTHVSADYDNVRAALQWMLECERSTDSIRLCNALSHLWDVRGQLSEGRYWLRAALDLPAQAVTIARADAYELAGRLAIDQGDWSQAVALLDHALTLCRALDDTRCIAQLLRTQGWLALMRGAYDTATMLLDESVGVYQALGDNQGIASVRGLQGQVSYEQGAFAQAVPLLTESIALARSSNDQIDLAWSINKLGLVALYQGDTHEAERLLNESLALFDVYNYTRGIAWVLSSLGWIRLAQRDVTRAAALLKESMARYSVLGEKRNIAFSLERLASLAAVQQQPTRAARLFGAAAALRRLGAILLPPADEAYYTPYVTLMRDALPADRAATAWAEGEALSLEQAIAYALQHDEREATA